MRGIEHANRVLDMYENLQQDDMPPEWMLPFDAELKKWFEAVEDKRGNGPTAVAGGEETLRNDLADEFRQGT